MAKGKSNYEADIGSIIGIYKIIAVANEKAPDGHQKYHVKCLVCGREFVMAKNTMNRNKEKNSKCTHDHINWGKFEPVSSIYHDMRARCCNPKDKDYPNYGGRGIKICDEWIKNPLEFGKWAMENGYKKGLTLDRIDCNGNYCPENCAWIPRKDNCSKKRTNCNLTVDGVTKNGQEWATDIGLGQNRINIYRRKYGELQTIEFIRRITNDPDWWAGKVKKGINYFDYYMNDDRFAVKKPVELLAKAGN